VVIDIPKNKIATFVKENFDHCKTQHGCCFRFDEEN
jgi:hypothetical protein